MLHLLLQNGCVDRVEGVTRACLDKAKEELVCYDEVGKEVARYQKSIVSAFSLTAFPDAEEERPEEQMLQLLFQDGTVSGVQGATQARLDETSSLLICCDEDGKEVARYPKRSVSAFGPTPLDPG